jgi:hypothetical protein
MKSRYGWSVCAVGVVVAALVVGCSASAGIGGPPPGCGTDSTVSCAQGEGWSCAAGDNPEAEQSGLSCSDPTPDGSSDDFCCFSWGYGDSSCTPDDELTCAPGSYGYRCNSDDTPDSLDPSLNCSSATTDGTQQDFCCQ